MTQVETTKEKRKSSSTSQLLFQSRLFNKIGIFFGIGSWWLDLQSKGKAEDTSNTQNTDANESLRTSVWSLAGGWRVGTAWYVLAVGLGWRTSLRSVSGGWEAS